MSHTSMPAMPMECPLSFVQLRWQDWSENSLQWQATRVIKWFRLCVCPDKFKSVRARRDYGGAERTALETGLTPGSARSKVS
jgi:hypothetical protein